MDVSLRSWGRPPVFQISMNNLVYKMILGIVIVTLPPIIDIVIATNHLMEKGKNKKQTKNPPLTPPQTTKTEQITSNVWTTVASFPPSSLC